LVSCLQTANSSEAGELYNATKKLLDEALVYEADDLIRGQGAVTNANAAVDQAKVYLEQAQHLLKAAEFEQKRVQETVNAANEESARANTFALAEAACGDQARARVAFERSNIATHNSQLANEQASLAVKSFSQVKANVTAAELAVNQAASYAASANSLHLLARKEAENLAVARKSLKDVEFEARKTYNEEDALRKKDLDTQADEFLKKLSSYKGTADERFKEIFARASQIKQYADWANERRQQASDAAERAKKSAELAYASNAEISQSVTSAAQRRADATRSAEMTGRVLVKESEVQKAWDVAEELASFEAAVRALTSANAGSDENGVRRAQEATKAAETLASNEWRKADLRIAEGEANARRSRSESVTGPSSPFYFASTAHFPLREFGLRGEPLDRDGIIIYEDMAFHFDRDGNYEVHFRASAPAMPATVRLQFQIQSHRNGPWCTVTLAPIEFPYPGAKSDKSNCSGSNCGEGHSDCNDDSKDCCGKARECICKGKSEILKRCYGEMGQDAKIRRSGTARIGFGVNVPN